MWVYAAMHAQRIRFPVPLVVSVQVHVKPVGRLIWIAEVKASFHVGLLARMSNALAF